MTKVIAAAQFRKMQFTELGKLVKFDHVFRSNNVYYVLPGGLSTSRLPGEEQTILKSDLGI